MLPKTERLSRTDFQSIYANGRRTHSPVGTVIFKSGPTFHGAVVVSKKVGKQAVLRNKLRRQVYGQLTTHLKQKGITGTVIVLLKPAAAAMSEQARRVATKQLIEQVGKPAYNSPHV